MEYETIHDLINKNGYYVEKGFLSDNLLSLAFSFGKPVPNKRDQKIIQEIQPETTKLSNPNTLSSRYGLSAFPYHTETAYRRTPIHYLILYCQHPGSGDRPTQLIDFSKIQFSMKEEKILKSEVWKVVQVLRPFLVTIFKPDAYVRFDMDCMKPVNECHKEAAQIIHSKLSTTDEININWEANDLLIVDNFRMLHARGQANKPDKDRILKRILVED